MLKFILLLTNSIADLESAPGLFLSDKAVRTELRFILVVCTTSSLMHFTSSMSQLLNSLSCTDAEGVLRS
jgi:hypothetical protein